ncbi:zinc ribbon domain-containing protein [Brumimicrobium sp.]|uniref:zinc ribbon domain-containing protein n=1 Tax=Brumimicrobium sp. TaxID=2029867 RepID=UPI0026181968|nr:C4-type zinc ribbon domain-containing protein [uncultured Brumimicrobium sp.]
MATKAKAKSSTTVAERLEALANLQQIDSEIDRILTIRGELPLEVEDLEADIEGLEKRVEKLTVELKDIETEISNRKNEQKDAQAAILQYKEKQNNVRNNREFESLSKEIEYQELEIQLHEKRAKEAKATIENKKEVIKEVQDRLAGRKKDLKAKKAELDNIIAETEKDEEKLNKKSEKAMKQLDDHLRTAYARLRSSAKNGLAVVPVDRDSCGGCFNRIPPQRQLDIIQKKKIIICEHCGRILIPGEEIEEEVDTKAKKKKK